MLTQRWCDRAPFPQLKDRIEKLAVDILHSYKFRTQGTRVHMLCVLKGGHQFFSDLCNALKALTLTGCSEPPLTSHRSSDTTAFPAASPRWSSSLSSSLSSEKNPSLLLKVNLLASFCVLRVGIGSFVFDRGLEATTRMLVP